MIGLLAKWLDKGLLIEVVASPEPIDVKMGGGQRMEDETLFSGNPGMGNPTDDAAVQSCGH
jgi:hypothetical protein